MTAFPAESKPDLRKVDRGQSAARIQISPQSDAIRRRGLELPIQHVVRSAVCPCLRNGLAKFARLLRHQQLDPMEPEYGALG